MQRRSTFGGLLARLRRGALPALTALVSASAALPASAAPPPFAGEQAVNQIELFAVREDEGGADVYVETVDVPLWSISQPSAGSLELVLSATLPGPTVSDLAKDEGLVESARVRAEEVDGELRTVITISTRSPVTYGVEADANRLRLRLERRASVPIATDPSSSTTGSDTAPAEVAAMDGTGAAGESEAPADDAQGSFATAPATDPALSTASAPEYRIGEGDVLEIRVFELAELDRTVRILADGTASLPLLGQVALAGLTPQEAEGRIESLLAERQLVNDPQVTLFVREYVSRGVSIQGAVNNPGVYQMIEARTLLDMLGEAGGLTGRDTERAGQKIFVLRTGEEGATRRIEIDATRLIDEGDPTLNLPLLPGDVVMVPHSKRLRVYVTGAVKSPGPIEYQSSQGISVLQAITAAGGPVERSNLRKVFILRRLEDGSQLRIPVNVKRVQRGLDDDPPLLGNDTVVVGEWFF